MRAFQAIIMRYFWRPNLVTSTNSFGRKVLENDGGDGVR